MRLLPIFSLCLSLAACYETRTGCLDPDAANYDLGADEDCEDGCCTYPELAVRIIPTWEGTAIERGASYTDGGGNAFQFVRFRFYLGELRLEGESVALTDPANPLMLRTLGANSDTTDVELNGNLLLSTLSTTTTDVGSIRFGATTLTALSGTYGLPERYRPVIPASAPGRIPLSTQPGLLNFRDGRGYVQSRLEYTLEPGGDTLSVSSYGSVPFTLNFGGTALPARGFDLRVDVAADLDRLIGDINLTSDSAAIADRLGRPDYLSVIGLAQ